MYSSSILTLCYYVVGWRDFHFFVAIFENGHIPVDWLKKFKVQFQKNPQILSRTLAAHVRQSFHFQKITEASKMNIYFKFANTFHSLQRTIAKN